MHWLFKIYGDKVQYTEDLSSSKHVPQNGDSLHTYKHLPFCYAVCPSKNSFSLCLSLIAKSLVDKTCEGNCQALWLAHNT
jgi:coproporphyrinogen III oxidase-like Fe-S oxidoreductase